MVRSLTIMLAFIIIILLFLVFWTVFTFNLLIRKRNAIDQAYYSIDVMLRKRYDLIPMIVDTVRGYITHEKDVLESLSRIRASVLSGTLSVNEKVGADNQINHFIEKVVLMSENYPVLKASPSF